MNFEPQKSSFVILRSKFGILLFGLPVSLIHYSSALIDSANCCIHPVFRCKILEPSFKSIRNIPG
jgi:hypothetical protein